MVRTRPRLSARQGVTSGQADKDANDSPSVDVKKIDRTIMDNFYRLVHTQPNVRLTAACSTYKILAALKKSKSAIFNQHLNYCVERLVRGLASSRAMARRGYATLLLEILKRNQVSSERLFTIAQQEFGNISNEATKDNLLGYYLLINVILESGNLERIKHGHTYIEKIYKILRQLMDQKSYFDYPVSKLLCDRYDIFHESMLADIPAAAFGSDTRLTHTELLLISLCNKHKRIAQLTTLDSSHVLKMSQVLTGERLKRRPLHPVWIEWNFTIIDCFTKIYKDFLETIVHPTFFKPNHNDLAAMGLELTAKILSTVDHPGDISNILNPYIVRLLITSLRSKNPLSKHCNDFFSTLSRSFAESESDSSQAMVQAHIIIRLITPPGSIAFDQDSKSQSLSNLLNNCNCTALQTLTRHLFRVFDEEMSLADQKRTLPFVGKLLAHIVSRPQFRTDRNFDISKIAKWLIVNSLFACVDPLANEKEFWVKNKEAMPVKQPLELETKNSLKSAYHAVMDFVVTSSSAEQRICTMGSYVDFCNQLIHHGAAVFYKHTGDITRTWQVYMVGLIEYRKLCSANGDPKILYPISSLYLLYGLQILEHGLNFREQLTDLYQAAQDALKNDPSDGSWADILTDQIISILSATECNSWIRKLCVSIFGSLLPHISETSIDLLCDVMRAPIASNFGDDDDEGSEGCSEMDAQEMTTEENVGHEGNISDGSGDAMEARDEGHEEMASSKLQAREESSDEDAEIEFTDGSDSSGEESQIEETDEVQEDASEKKRSDADSEEEEEEYLNDEEMMKLDSVLVDMFKQNRVGAKKKRRDPSFKLRCLDLVKKVLAKKHNDTEVSNKILLAIIPVGAKSRKSADTRPIAEKIDSMIAKMPGKSKLNISGLMNGKRASEGANSTISPDPALDEEQLVADAQ